MFLTEVGKLDIITKVSQDYKPEEELVEIYINRRRSIVPKMKSFRRSQASKESWRQNRYKYMSGIKRFHKSTEGKQLHRSLGRFLATRDLRTGYSRNNESFTIHEVCEVLKAISSLKTHCFIEHQYYMSVDEQVDYEIMTEELLPVVNRIEEAIVHGQLIDTQDLEFLSRMITPQVIADEMVTSIGLNSKVTEDFSHGLLETGSYLDLIYSFKEKVATQK